jgi:hypothetical protein
MFGVNTFVYWGGTSKLSELFVMGQSKRLLAKIKITMKKHSQTPW